MRSWNTLLSLATTLGLVACSNAHKDPLEGTKAVGSGEPAGVPSFIPLEPEIPVSISVFEALGSTEHFLGRKVLIAGVFGRELNGIFATREHAKLNLPEYGVALGTEPCELSKPVPQSFSDLDALDGEYVRVEARLSTKVRGEHSIFRVGLCDVTRIATAGFVANDLRDAGPAGAKHPTRPAASAP